MPPTCGPVTCMARMHGPNLTWLYMYFETEVKKYHCKFVICKTTALKLSFNKFLATHTICFCVTNFSIFSLTLSSVSLSQVYISKIKPLEVAFLSPKSRAGHCAAQHPPRSLQGHPGSEQAPHTRWFCVNASLPLMW